MEDDVWLYILYKIKVFLHIIKKDEDIEKEGRTVIIDYFDLMTSSVKYDLPCGLEIL